MNSNQKIAIGIFAVTLLAMIWLFRWDIEASSSDNRDMTVRLDRWTGGGLLWSCWLWSVPRQP
jgi:hypothetical protein